MSLQTPEKIRALQNKLYLKAKREPAYRFYLLYDKVWRADILLHSYGLCRANGGERLLGIPTVRDRVVQQAAKLVLEPIFEAGRTGPGATRRSRRVALSHALK